MKIFTIEKRTNNITVHATVQEADAVANAERFRNEAALIKVAADWPMARLAEIWNELPGVTPIAKFKDRPTAISRIWKAIQTLGADAGQPTVEECRPAEPQTAAAKNVGPEADGATDMAPSADPMAEMVVDVPRTESAPEAVPNDVAPPRAHVAPEDRPAKKKTAREEKTSSAAQSGMLCEGSKTSRVVAMLRRDGGTTLEEIMTAMGWQKHTTRAMLSAGGSLTKNHGLKIVSEKVGEHRRYWING